MERLAPSYPCCPFARVQLPYGSTNWAGFRAWNRTSDLQRRNSQSRVVGPTPAVE